MRRTRAYHGRNDQPARPAVPEAGQAVVKMPAAAGKAFGSFSYEKKASMTGLFNRWNLDRMALGRLAVGLATAIAAFAAHAQSPGRTLMRFPTLYENTIV